MVFYSFYDNIQTSRSVDDLQQVSTITVVLTLEEL